MATIDKETLDQYQKEVGAGRITLGDLPDADQIVNMSNNFGRDFPDALAQLSDAMNNATISYTVEALAASEKQVDGEVAYYCIYATVEVNTPTPIFNDPSARGWFLTDVDIVGVPQDSNMTVNPGTAAPGTAIGSTDDSTSAGISFSPGIGVLGDDGQLTPGLSYSWTQTVTRSTPDVSITFQDESPNTHWHFSLGNAPQMTHGPAFTVMTDISTSTMPLQLFWVWRCPFQDMPAGSLAFDLNLQVRYAARFLHASGGLPFMGNDTGDENITFQYNFSLPTLQFPGNPPPPRG